MRIRLDFVTNSSSSSYIIAKHKDITTEDIKNYIESHDINKFVKKYGDYIDFIDMPALKHASMETKVQLITEELIQEIQNSSGIKIQDWDVDVEEGSSESGNLFSVFLYCYAKYIETDKLIIASKSY